MEVWRAKTVTSGAGGRGIAKVGVSEEDPEAEAVSAWEEWTSFLRLIAAESHLVGGVLGRKEDG